MVWETLVVKETEYPTRMDWNLVEQWAEIPWFGENDPHNPEWKPSPVIHADLSSFGYGEVFIKNEADISTNPTGTIKDRPAWEFATLYRDFARMLYMKKKEGVLNGNLSSFPVPRFSLISAGNAVISLAEMFRVHCLPPIKVLVDLEHISLGDLIHLRNLHTDIYVNDLATARLTAADIKKATNNEALTLLRLWQ